MICAQCGILAHVHWLNRAASTDEQPMSLRENIQSRPVVAGALAGALIIIAAMVIFHETLGQPHRSVRWMNSAFYSDDDGKTWFIDDIGRIPPFDHNGKTAVRAVVFCSGAGKQFVAYLEKFSDAQQTEIEAGIAAHPEEKSYWLNSRMLVKRPGDSAWLYSGIDATPEQRAAYQKAMIPISPDGSSNISLVLPGDPYATE